MVQKSCTKPCKWWDVYHINRLAGFLNHQQFKLYGPRTAKLWGEAAGRSAARIACKNSEPSNPWGSQDRSLTERSVFRTRFRLPFGCRLPAFAKVEFHKQSARIWDRGGNLRDDLQCRCPARQGTQKSTAKGCTDWILPGCSAKNRSHNSHWHEEPTASWLQLLKAASRFVGEAMLHLPRRVWSKTPMVTHGASSFFIVNTSSQGIQSIY